MSKLDFPYQYVSTLKHFYEWGGNLLVFGYAGALMMGLPPTNTPPPGKELIFQTTGTFNQTYTFEGTAFIHLLPLGNDTNRCAALTSRMLVHDQQNQSDAESDHMYHLFLNNVESARTVVSFEELKDEDLRLAPITIDLYFRRRTDFIKSSFIITFKNYKPGHWLWLWIVVCAAAALLISISILCIVKFSKAIKKEGNYSLVDATPSNDAFTAEPLINENIPDRLAAIRAVEWNK